MLIFGCIDENTPRNKVIVEGLTNKDVNIEFVNVPRKYEFRGKANVKLSVLKILYRIVYMNLYATYKLIRNVGKLNGESHILMLSYSNFIILPAALISKVWRKKVSLDSHGSVFFTQVIGRKYVKRNSTVAKLLWVADKISIKVCDEYLVFTKHAKKITSDIYSERKETMKVVYTGTLRPPETNIKERSGVVYWGNFINFHGTEKFIDSVNLLRDEYDNFEEVVLIGNGEKKEKCKKRVEKLGIENVSFLGFVSKDELEKRISQAKLTIGVFGENKYMDACITNKVCEAAARGKAIVTKTSPAIKEIFRDGKSIKFTHKNDPKNIAKTMHEILKSKNEIKKLEVNSEKVFENSLTPKKVADQLLGRRSQQ